MEDLRDLVGEQVSASEKQQLLELVNEFRDTFAVDLSELGKSTTGSMEIRLLDNEPVVYRPYRLSYAEREFVKEHIKELKRFDIIRDSKSPYATPILLVKKKTGEARICCDFRRLNAKTIKDRYPLPRIDDLLDQLSEAKCYTTLDMAQGYWQIRVGEESIEKTGFVTPDGHFEWLRMPFGLCNGGAVFQRVMNEVLSPVSDLSLIHISEPTRPY